jgi:hypothetical protein
MGGLGPISFLALDRAAVRFGFDEPDAFDEFRQKVRLLDRHWLLNFAPGVKKSIDGNEEPPGKTTPPKKR